MGQKEAIIPIPAEKLATYYGNDVNKSAQDSRTAANTALGPAEKKLAKGFQPVTANEIVQFAEFLGQTSSSVLQINTALMRLANADTVNKRAKAREQIIQVASGIPLKTGVTELFGKETDNKQISRLTILSEEKMFGEHWLDILHATHEVTAQVDSKIPSAAKNTKIALGRTQKIAELAGKSIDAYTSAKDRANTASLATQVGLNALENKVTSPQFQVTADLKPIIADLMKNVTRESKASIEAANAQARAMGAIAASFPAAQSARVETVVQQMLIEMSGTMHLAFGYALSRYLENVYLALMLSSQQIQQALKPLYDQMKLEQQTMISQINQSGQILKSNQK